MALKPALRKTRKSKVSLLTRLSVRLSHTEQLLLTKYLSVLLQSGLPIDDALDILLEQSNASLKTILTTLRQSVRTGSTLANGLERYPHIFSNVFVNLIRAGEASGNLQKNLEQLALQMQKEHDLRAKIRGAMMYPSIVMASALIVVTGIVVFILPKITQLFTSLHVELPWTTRALLWMANLFSNHGLLISLGVIVLILAVGLLRRVPFIQPLSHALFLRIPVIGGIARNANVARITRLLGTLLNSGMPINDALPITISVMKNYHYRKLFVDLEKTIGQGGTIANALAKSKFLFPPIAQRLIRVGEETGSLGDMLVYLAGFYEQEVDDTTKNATTLLEPALIVMIGAMVGLLAFSIVTPIYSVLGSI